MYVNRFAILICLVILMVESISLTRSRRREFVQEEVRKTMLNYMTSIKGEITDIVLDEMIDYYNNQRSKLYYLENELSHIKNSSLPMMYNNSILNDLVIRISEQQRSFAANVSLMENKIMNLTNMIDQLQREKSIQHVKRLVSIKNEKLPRDCDDVFHQQSSAIDQGIFRIKPRFASESFEVKCIFENAAGIGWTVIQQRINGLVDFYRGWNDYENGFGDLQTEFWLGNEKIHQLTNQGRYILRIDLTPWNAPIQMAEYGQFALANATENYRLQISNFRSNISTSGDSLSSIWDTANGASFSTYDRDYDHLFYDNCALIYHGAWWFTNCFQSHLNGAYIRLPLALQNTARNGLHWNTYALYHSMKQTTMRIRRDN